MTLAHELTRAEDTLESEGDEFTLASALLTVTVRHMLPDLVASLDPEDFFDPHISEMWAAARTLTAAGKAVSQRTILAERDTPGIRSRIRAASGEPVTTAKVRQAAENVADLAKERRLIQALKRVAEFTGQGTYSETLQFAADQLAALDEAKPARESRLFADALADWQDWLDAPHEHVRTIPTPWTELNEILAGGLHPGRSYVIGGRPGEGKSIALLNFVTHAAEQGHPGVVFSVEMGEGEVVSRIMASGAHADYGQITRRNLDDFNRHRLAEYADTYGAMPLTLVDKSDVTVDYIAATCRTLKRTRGLEVIVVDYLQLLRETDSRQARERQVAHISRSLKVLARELDAVVIVACQLNRNAASADRKPTLTELRESGAIEQDGDVVILLHHEKVNGEPTGEVSLVVAKNRTGKLATVVLPWRAYQARMG